MGIFVTTLAVIVILLIIFKVVFKLAIGWDRSDACLIGKTVIVTGANTGIGFYTAKEFAKRGGRVILACRNKHRAEEAKEEIIKATTNSNVVVKIIDFASLTSVRNFSKEINAEENRLDILVNNAGAAGFDDVKTEDGNNMLMQVNHLGPFLLTILLIDLLKRSAPSRIVNVSSAASHFAKLDPNNLNAFPTKHAQTVNYANTKLCNILFTNELARRLKGINVLANSLHPGIVRTEIFRTLPVFTRTVVHGIINAFFKTSEEGAQTSIYVALSKDIEGISGEYFDDCRIALFPPMASAGRDEGLARKVWEKSEELVNVTAEERRL